MINYEKLTESTLKGVFGGIFLGLILIIIIIGLGIGLLNLFNEIVYGKRLKLYKRIINHLKEKNNNSYINLKTKDLIEYYVCRGLGFNEILIELQEANVINMDAKN